MTLEELKKRLPRPLAPVTMPQDIEHSGSNVLSYLTRIRQNGRVALNNEVETVDGSLQALKEDAMTKSASLMCYQRAHDLAQELVERFGQQITSAEAVCNHFGQEDTDEWGWQFPIPGIGDKKLIIPEGKSLGETKDHLFEKMNTLRSQSDVSQQRFYKAQLKIVLMQIALELDLAEETIEGLDIRRFPINKVSPDWKSRHEANKEWVIYSFEQARPKTSSQEQAIKLVIQQYEKHITPQLEEKYPGKPYDQLVISRDSILRFIGKKI